MKRGLVIKSTGNRSRVIDSSGNITECVIKGKFRMKGIRTTNPVAVGDYVKFEEEKVQGSAIITEIEKRRNYIIRKSSKLSKESQIIAANIDQLIILATIKMPETHAEFIDRVLASAEAYRIPALVVFNKTDLYADHERKKMDELVALYNEIGYRSFGVSLINENEKSELATIVQGKVTLLTGNSGVGKSTLINLLNPSLEARVEKLSDYHMSGKHTTTFSEMYAVNNNTYIIDTPGIKGFGMIDMDKEEIYHFFPEIFRLSKACRYHNCLHLDEPGCEVKNSVVNGDIEWSRYNSYLSILEDNNSKYR
ncbi:MAG: ribosome small subunit-dependent GTPase A [Bacteroidales bacterium]|nr:ribosome small subunit-dependent GTPase A [Bacteroidales bacterium]